MIVLDDGPHSKEIWTWYRDQRDDVDLEQLQDTEVDIFRTILDRKVVSDNPDDDTQSDYDYDSDASMSDDDETPTAQQRVTTYYKMNAGQFYAFLFEILQIATGISKFCIPQKCTVEDIAAELKKVHACVLWWAFAEGVPPERFGVTMDHNMIDKEKGRLNQFYRFRGYYISRIIQESFAQFRTQWASLTNIGKQMTNLSETAKKYIVQSIKSSCAGDQDEFILYCIEYIQNMSMTDHHEKLAQLIRLETFDNHDFETRLQKSETWRMLFSEHFEGVDERFVDFITAHGPECVLYFLHDMLASDCGLEHVRWYNVYTFEKSPNVTTDIFSIIPVDKVKRELKRVYTQYKLS